VSAKPKSKYLFTFGCGTPLAACVQPVLAKDEDEARHAMYKFYASRWAFCYKSGDCSLRLEQFTALPDIEVSSCGEVYVVNPLGGLKPPVPAVKHVQPKPKYKVRLTRMLSTWVEVEADTQDEAESKAYDEAVGKAKDDPCWSDDDDVQVEDDTHVMVDGEWKRARFVPKTLGGEGVKPTPEGD